MPKTKKSARVAASAAGPVAARLLFYAFFLTLPLSPAISAPEQATPEAPPEAGEIRSYVSTRLFVLFKESSALGPAAREELLRSVLGVRIKGIRPLFGQNPCRDNWILRTKLKTLEEKSPTRVVTIRAKKIKETINISEIRKKNGLDRAFAVEFEQDQDIPRLVSALKKEANVEDAEGDRMMDAKRDHAGNPAVDLTGIEKWLFDTEQKKAKGRAREVAKKTEEKPAQEKSAEPVRSVGEQKVGEKSFTFGPEDGQGPLPPEKKAKPAASGSPNWLQLVKQVKDRILETVRVYIADKWGIREGGSHAPNEETVIAVIGTGVDYDHKELSGKIWINTGEKSGDENGDGCAGVCWMDDDENGLIDEDSAGCSRSGFDASGKSCAWANDLAGDDDENGFADDLRGWDFAGGDGDPMDDTEQKHGTRGARKIVSSAKKKKWDLFPLIMPVKVLNKNGSGALSGLLAGIEYAAANGARVLSCPVEEAPGSFALRMILGYARDMGIYAGFSETESAGTGKGQPVDVSDSDADKTEGFQNEGGDQGPRLNLEGVKPLWERTKEAPVKRIENPYAEAPDELVVQAGLGSPVPLVQEQIRSPLDGEIQTGLPLIKDRQVELNTVRTSVRIPFPRFKSKMKDLLRNLESASPVPTPSPKKQAPKLEIKESKEDTENPNSLAVTTLQNVGNRSIRWSGHDPEGNPLKYSYRIDEGPWSKPAAINSITLSKSIKLGMHTVYVKAVNSAGLESPEKQIEFEVLKQKIDFKTAKKTAQ